MARKQGRLKQQAHHKQAQGTAPRQKGPSTYLLYGKHACVAALQNPQRTFRKLYITPDTEKELGVRFPKGLIVERMGRQDLDRFAGDEAVHQGVALEVEPLPNVPLEEVTESRLIVVLDQVTDPQNVGAILRSSAAFGAGAVILPKDHAPSETASLAKAASGALEVTPIVRVTNIRAALDKLKEEGFWCLGMDGEAATTIDKAPDYDKVVLVMGAEGKGLRPSTREACDLLVKLPMTGAVESLNVSNAAAIALYELYDGSTLETGQ